MAQSLSQERSAGLDLDQGAFSALTERVSGQAS
jgi:hypothetical protein